MPNIPDILEPVADFFRDTFLPLLTSICHAVAELLRRLFTLVTSLLESVDGAEALQKILAFAAVCDFFLLWGAWSLWNMPTMGFGVNVCALLSTGHTLFMWMAIRRHQLISRLLEAYSTAFLVGLMVGLTLMMVVLSLLIAIYFGNVLKSCRQVAAEIATASVIQDFECYSRHRFAMRSVAVFESFLVFVYGILSTFLILSGENIGLAGWSSHQYENLDPASVPTT